MPIRFPCTACGQLLGIATRKVGTEIHCPTCGLAVIVPDEAQAKLLRQRARGENQQPFPTPDTPPEISIPRERHEAFDGGLESFLTQLDVTPAASKPLAANASAKVKSPQKPAPPQDPTSPVVKSTTASPPKNGSNGTHVSTARPAAPHVPSGIKPPAALAPAPKSQPLPATPAQEFPLAFEDHEVSVLSAADLLELADEHRSPPALPPSAKTSPPPVQSSTALKSTISAPSKQGTTAKPPSMPGVKESSPAPTVVKQTPTQSPAIIASPPLGPLTEIAPSVESLRPAVTDFGIDFSSPVPATVTSRKSEPSSTPAVAASPTAAAIPAAPFDNAVWISRRAIYTHVAILVLVSLATFLIGWVSGGAGARAPGSNQAAPVRFEALIQYVAANGKTLPDEGAVVLLWPKQAKPLERLSIKRLAPSEPAPPADFPTLKAIETLRGAYTRTNAQGEVRDLMLTEPGEYYVLVISRNLARPPMEPINEKVVPILGDLFGGDAVTLLGTRQYTLKSYYIADTRTLNHTFGAAAEK